MPKIRQGEFNKILEKLEKLEQGYDKCKTENEIMLNYMNPIIKLQKEIISSGLKHQTKQDLNNRIDVLIENLTMKMQKPDKKLNELAVYLDKIRLGGKSRNVLNANHANHINVPNANHVNLANVLNANHVNLVKLKKVEENIFNLE